MRLDSGNDAADNFDHFGQNYFIVKRNLRKESREQWLATARRVGVKRESRDGKNSYIGYVDHLHPGGDTSRACVPVVFEVIDLYHDHGTSEQFHSELKSDLDIERLPSGKLCVNKIILLCGMLAFNLLRGLGQEVIRRAALAPQKITVSRWRLKTVLQNIIYCAVRIVHHASRIELHYGKRCPWFDIIADIARSRA